ncbi:hypothetical protein MYU51_009769 [Penicillium brevicompactum]
MPPSKWDDEEEDVPPPVSAPRRRFDDEEEEEDVLESWDAAEDSEVEREKAKKAADAEAAAKAKALANKKTKAQRIEENREKHRLEKEDFGESDSEDEADRRARLRKTEQEADLAHAEDLFGSVDVKRNKGAPKAVVVTDSKDPTNSVDLSAMPLFKPTTKDQFNRLTEILVPLLTPHTKKAQYSLWAQDFTRKLVKELPSAEIKKIASALTTASNEKMREERASDKGNKKSKAAKTKISLNASRDAQPDTSQYDDDGLGDDDFIPGPSTFVEYCKLPALLLDLLRRLCNIQVPFIIQCKQCLLNPYTAAKTLPASNRINREWNESESSSQRSVHHRPDDPNLQRNNNPLTR